MNGKEIIKRRISTVELLIGLAEESIELAHAALKLRRVFDKNNPTPVDEEHAIANLYEEAADTLLYIRCLDLNMQDIENTIHWKTERWVHRLEDQDEETQQSAEGNGSSMEVSADSSERVKEISVDNEKVVKIVTCKGHQDDSLKAEEVDWFVKVVEEKVAEVHERHMKEAKE